MPHYNQQDIECINAVDINRVLHKLGIEYDARRKKYRCPSPKHEDKHPSMSVKNNCWHCFACGEGGNVINLVMTVYDIDFSKACEWIINTFNLSFSGKKSQDRIKYVPVKKVISSRTEYKEKQIGDEEILQYIISNAALSPKAMSFLYDERKFSPEVIEQLNIGSITDESKFVNFLNQKFSSKRLISSHVICRDGIHSAWKPPCILFPFYDSEGRLINIVSRRIDNPEIRYKFKSIEGVNTIPYNLPILKKMKDGDTLCIMEGLTDTLAALSNGWQAIGLHGCTNRLVDYDKLLSPFKLVYYHQNDDPGRESFVNRQKELRNFFIPLEEGIIDSQYKDFSKYYATTKYITKDVDYR